MYQRILVPVENSSTDAHIIEHVARLARHCNASVLLIHVADGWAARNIKHLSLRESEEIKEDREYIEGLAAKLVAQGLNAEALLATGDPSREILLAADREKIDLIAMATHGHKLIGDMIHGSVASSVRHSATQPVLLLRAPAAGSSRE